MRWSKTVALVIFFLGAVNAKLSMYFLYEFYPSAIMNWDDVMIVDYGIHKFQVVYLGWNEYRCGDTVMTHALYRIPDVVVS